MSCKQEMDFHADLPLINKTILKLYNNLGPTPVEYKPTAPCRHVSDPCASGVCTLARSPAQQEQGAGLAISSAPVSPK